VLDSVLRALRAGDRSPRVVLLRQQLARVQGQPGRGGVPSPSRALEPGTAELFDGPLERAVRAFQQTRGLQVDGVVGAETWRALQEAGEVLGNRLLVHSVSRPMRGDDVLDLQRRLLAMGFDPGRCDGELGARTVDALARFQREVGLRADGSCGPLTLTALARLRHHPGRGGNPHELREAEALRRRGPTLAGTSVVIDPGHGGEDMGAQAGSLRESEIVWDVASRLEGRLVAAGAQAVPTRGPQQGGAVRSDRERAALANSTDADLCLSLHCEWVRDPSAHGVASYYFGSSDGSGSVVGARLADLAQREVVARTGLLDCRSHAKTWPLLRMTRMPAVRVDLGHLSHPGDAAALADPGVRDALAEALLVAVQRLLLPEELDPPTGTMRLPAGFLARTS